MATWEFVCASAGALVGMCVFKSVQALGRSVSQSGSHAASASQVRPDSEAVRVAEEKYRLIFENAIEGIFQTSPDGRYLSANPRLAKIYGYESADSLMQCLCDIQQQLYIEPQRRSEFMQLMDQHDEIRDFESQIRRRDGSVIWISENARAIRDTAGQLLYYEGTVEDITHRKQAVALLAEKEAALAASRAKSTFLAHMSHEIRTPLNGVIGMLQLLNQTKLDERQIRYTQVARSSADNLLAIINDVLDFSKIEAGKLELESLPFNLHDLLEEVTELFSHRAQSQNLELYCRTTPDVPAAVCGDAQRLRQVLINLLGNALKFTKQGTISLRAELINRQPDGRTNVRLCVQDTGIGIPAERRHRLFSPFSQVDGSTTRRFGGTGLGLAICRQIVELMGGQLSVDSEPDIGSTFTVMIPLQAVDLPPAGFSCSPNLNGLRVLLVDDRQTTRTMLRELLECWRMQVEELPQGVSLCDHLRAAAAACRPFSVVFVAHSPPEQDALALIRECRTHRELVDLRAVVLEGMDSALDPKCCAAVDAVLLTKPVRQSRLFDSLATVLHRQAGGSRNASPPVVAARFPAANEDLRLSPAAPPVDGTSATILVAEDNEINQLVTSEILRSRGYDCDLVATGQQAIDALLRKTYPLVLMDCQMPELDGFDATRQIRRLEAAGELKSADGRPVPIIALTANAVRGDRELCLEAGMNDYATKPVDREQLLKLIERYVPLSHGDQVTSRDGEQEPSDERAPIDRESLLARCGGDQQFANQLLQRFQAKLPLVCLEVGQAAERDDWALARRLAHTLKGTAANLGARRLSQAALAVEEALATPNPAAVQSPLRILEQEIECCLGQLDQILVEELATT